MLGRRFARTHRGRAYPARRGDDANRCAGHGHQARSVNLVEGVDRDLIKRRGEDEENEGTIAHGVGASTTMALDITPDHPLVHQYLAYVPESKDDKVCERWKKMVHDPVDKALRRYHPVLKAHNMMEEVFRFQDLDALVDRLDPPSKA